MGLVKRKPPASVEEVPSRARDELLAELWSDESGRRCAAARDLAAHPEVASELVRRYGSEPDPRVRDVIGTALLSSGSTEAATLLAPYLSAEDASLRNGARELLLLAQGAELVADSLLKDPDADVRMFAIEILVNRAGSRAADALSGALESEDDVNVCAFAVEQLGRIGDLVHVTQLDALTERLGHDDFLAFAIALARKLILSRTCDLTVSN